MMGPAGNLVNCSNPEPNSWQLNSTAATIEWPLQTINSFELLENAPPDDHVLESFPLNISRIDDCSTQQLEYLDTHKYDYICGVLTTRRTECRRSLCCNTHSYNDKLLVPRTLPFDELYRQEQTSPTSFRNSRALVKKYFNYLESLTLERPTPAWSQSKSSIKDVIESSAKPKLLQPRKSKSKAKMEAYLLDLAKNTHSRGKETISYLHYKLRPFKAMMREEQEYSVLAKFN